MSGEKAKAAVDLMRPVRPQLGPRIFRCDLETLRAVLVLAACPVVCRGYLDGGEDWHQLCIDKADRAIEALEVGDC